jgi:hypothetical protein
MTKEPTAPPSKTEKKAVLRFKKESFQVPRRCPIAARECKQNPANVPTHSPVNELVQISRRTSAMVRISCLLSVSGGVKARDMRQRLERWQQAGWELVCCFWGIIRSKQYPYLFKILILFNFFSCSRQEYHQTVTHHHKIASYDCISCYIDFTGLFLPSNKKALIR